jgi:antirestriction protein ArdC
MATSDRKDEMIGRLTAGIEQLTSSQRWQEWLAVQSRFHHYSFRNALLIQLQCPEATRVAGFRAWQELGRQVRKGEKAIWILAPVTRKRGGDDVVDDDSNARILVAFKQACVFDISQTDGEPLPEVCSRLDGAAPEGVYDNLIAVAHSIGYSVEKDYLPGARNGDCDFVRRHIRVEVANAPAQQVKTLVHELAHAMLHENTQDRALAELEAESVAFVVCAALEVESDDYSFGYVTRWAGGGDNAIAGIKESAVRIQQTADQILLALKADAPAAVAA